MSWLMWLGFGACVSGEVEAKPDTMHDVEAAETTERVVASPSVPVPPVALPSVPVPPVALPSVPVPPVGLPSVPVPPEPMVVGDYRSVVGQVVDRWGAPVEGATVTAQVGRWDWTTSSDAEGRFVFAAVADQGLRFTAEADGGVATRWVQHQGPIAELVLVLEPAATVVVTSAFPEWDQVVVRHDQEVLARGVVGQSFQVRAHFTHELVMTRQGGDELVCGQVRLAPGEVLEVVCGARGTMRVTGRVIDFQGAPQVAARVVLSDGRRERIERSERDGRFEMRVMLDSVSECTVATTNDWQSYKWWPTIRRALTCRPGVTVDLGDVVLRSHEDTAAAAELLPFGFWRHTSPTDSDSLHHRQWEHGWVPWQGFTQRDFATCMWCGQVMQLPVWDGIDAQKLARNLGVPVDSALVSLDGRAISELGVGDVLAWRLLEPGALLELEVRDSDGYLRATEIEAEWLFAP